MKSPFSIVGQRNKPENPARIHVLIPYCLKSPDCPCGRYSSDCVHCGLCEVETIIEWATNNDYKYWVSQNTAFYESYFPNNIENMAVIVTFVCNADYIKTAAPRLVYEHDHLSLILANMRSSCTADEIERTKDDGARFLNHVENLELVLPSIEKYLEET
jgi:hypothetical protein